MFSLTLRDQEARKIYVQRLFVYDEHLTAILSREPDINLSYNDVKVNRVRATVLKTTRPLLWFGTESFSTKIIVCHIWKDALGACEDTRHQHKGTVPTPETIERLLEQLKNTTIHVKAREKGRIQNGSCRAYVPGGRGLVKMMTERPYFTQISQYGWL